MTLERRNVTIASRVMLPAYVAVNCLFAGVFLTDPQNRLDLVPSLAYARAWVPVAGWGCMWLGLAALMLAALLLRDRRTFVVSLATNCGVWFTWGFFVSAAVFSQPNVSPLAGVLPWFVAVASFASMMSLLAGER